ncbi:MAG: CoB--CoM heterodisulfide reductase iron-sulfur subunit A family protein [Anaerolineae bacterium]|jgi:heterodisulfide reductase subunit A
MTATPRVGVFVCHCGSNIAGHVDVEEVADYARTLPDVVFVQRNLYTCSDAGLREIKEAIAAERLDRVVVAACTPRTHEPLFQDTCREADLNPYLFEFVNIRDQCSWVHMKEPEAATRKAQDLVRMGVAKARLLEPLEEQEVPVEPAALVIGGGMIGMTAALNLANRGFDVKLVEREPKLGGMLLRLDRLYPTREDARKVVQERIADVRRKDNIEVFTSSVVSSVKGFVGNYDVLIDDVADGVAGAAGKTEDPDRATETPDDRSATVGAIIVATGAQVFQPEGIYGYDGKRVITQLELEQRFRVDDLDVDRVVMIQCVGARCPERPYCSRICCTTAIKNALEIKDRCADAEVYILYRDAETQGTRYEAYYGQAREAGIQFIRYDIDRPPEVLEERVLVYDEVLGARLSIPCDLIVLSTPLVAPEGVQKVAQMLKVPVDEHGFFLEAHVKLRPLDFATDGIYVAGTARWPSHLEETITQAYGAAARASTILSKERVTSSGIVAQVIQHLCRGCGRCVEICDFGAPSLEEAASGVRVAHVNPVMCKGCGACASVCPTGAMQARHFTDEQVTAMVRAALEPALSSFA